MADLKKEFEKLGYDGVKTVLASGNVIFETKNKKQEIIEKEIAGALQKKYGRGIAVFIRAIDELKRIETLQPFHGIKVTPNTRLYVTFCKEEIVKIAKQEMHPGFKILGVSGTTLFSVLELSPTIKTPDLMKVLGKSLGDTITVRNWNTIQKILTISSEKK